MLKKYCGDVAIWTYPLPPMSPLVTILGYPLPPRPRPPPSPGDVLFEWTLNETRDKYKLRLLDFEKKNDTSTPKNFLENTESAK